MLASVIVLAYIFIHLSLKIKRNLNPDLQDFRTFHNSFVQVYPPLLWKQQQEVVLAELYEGPLIGELSVVLLEHS
jgi:hypothetical protein